MFGVAFKEWLESIAPYNIWDVYWHYGMTIIGDPMVVLLEKSKINGQAQAEDKITGN